MSTLLRAENLKKTYHDGQRELAVLRGANMSVDRGQAVAVVGMSGSGKSTLLHLLGGLDRPDGGRIFFEKEELTAQSISQLNHFRNRQVGYVFQFHHLLPEFTALENVMMPALIDRQPRGQVQKRAMEALDRLGLAERATHRPAKLSGGEQQRIALVRALINQPSVLLADEPTGNLDVQTGQKVIDLMWEMTVRQNRSLVIVTHEPAIAARADVILRLHEGKLNAISQHELERHA